MDFLTTPIEEGLQNSDILVSILKFLNKKEQAVVQRVNKQFRSEIQLLNLLNIYVDFANWKKRILNTKKKNPNYKIITTSQNKILKMKYYHFPSQFFEGNQWEQIEDQKQVRLLVKEDKFVVENNNVFFKNQKTGDIMFINRSLIDEGLNWKNQKFDDEDSDEDRYKKLYEQSEITNEDYDFSNMQSMLSRQKQLISKLKKDNTSDKQTLMKNMENIQNLKQVAIILCCGGYFTLAIYDKNGHCFMHKSDHKYVVRKKAGQRQLAKDKNAGSNIKSMGSQIRRDQEVHHQKNVSTILKENFSVLEQSDVIFLQAPGVNKLILIQDNEPLAQLKHKIRGLCLTSKKAKYTENERLYKAISKVYLIFNNDQQQQQQQKQQQQ